MSVVVRFVVFYFLWIVLELVFFNPIFKWHLRRYPRNLLYPGFFILTFGGAAVSASVVALLPL